MCFPIFCIDRADRLTDTKRQGYSSGDKIGSTLSHSVRCVRFFVVLILMRLACVHRVEPQWLESCLRFDTGLRKMLSTYTHRRGKVPTVFRIVSSYFCSSRVQPISLYLPPLALVSSRILYPGIPTILTCTAWDGDLQAAKTQRSALAKLLEVAVPAPKKAAAEADGTRGDGKPRKPD